jgi:SAM-dependent methyltransferase
VEHHPIGEARLIRADALHLPLPDNSVDLIVTSPPYFALRDYKDGGESLDGQIGAEPTPEAFVDALIEATREMVRVCKPSGSIWVNLGDKYAGSAPGRRDAATRNAWQASVGIAAKTYLAHDGGGTPENWEMRTTVRAKSLIGIPWRYALRCIDELGLILRAEVIWAKPNGLPESVRDRVARKHEQWFHFTLEPRYFAAVDEIREPHAESSLKRAKPHRADVKAHEDSHTIDMTKACNPLGKLPGSVWTIATEPLKVPAELGIDHFAAFPTEWPRKIILGWSPSAICDTCGEGLRPVVEKEQQVLSGSFGARSRTMGWDEGHRKQTTSTITGYACACDTPGTTHPAVVLDPFCGTGTTVAVAKSLGRTGIGTDLSADYLRLADWRCHGDGFDKVAKKVHERTYGKTTPRSK